ncbi:MAG: DNA adenine methylase [Clostridium sp.]
MLSVPSPHSKRLQSVVIENKDFENLIRVYDRPGALFYLDPPYHGRKNIMRKLH